MIIDILKELEEARETKEEITENIFTESITLANDQAEYKKLLMQRLITLREAKTPTAIINKIAEGELYKYSQEIEIQTARVKMLKDKLENKRQDIEVLRSLLKNERELSQL